MPETPFDIHAIARGQHPFKLARIVLEDCSRYSELAVAQAEDAARAAFEAQFGEQPEASIAWCVEKP